MLLARLTGASSSQELTCCQQGRSNSKSVDSYTYCDQCIPDTDDATQASASEASFESSSYTQYGEEVVENKNNATASATIPSEVRAPAHHSKPIPYARSLTEKTQPAPPKCPNEILFKNNNEGARVVSLTTTKSKENTILKSSLRTISGKKTAAGQRRVRGLWNDNKSSPFAEIHDICLSNIFSYLPMSDTCTAAMVCLRWKQVASFEEAWTHVDATSFVKDMYRHHSLISAETAADATTEALSARLDRYSPLRLSILSIYNRLLADTFHPSLKIMVELNLTDFDLLTDTHVRVLLLPETREANRVKARPGQGGNLLKKLALRNCPLLTNASIQSIAQHCLNLEELDLSGNAKIDSVSSLTSLWKIQKLALPIMPLTSVAANPSSGLGSLFGPPAASLPRRPETPPPASHLASLFALPGTSPVKAIPTKIVTLSNSGAIGKLTRIRLDNTSVKASSFVKCLSMLDAGKAELAVLTMAGSGESWRDADCKRLCKCLDVTILEEFNMGCTSPGPTAVSDTGLQVLLKKATNLAKLGIAGHCAIGPACIERLSTLPRKQDLNQQGLQIDSRGCGLLEIKEVARLMA